MASGIFVDYDLTNLQHTLYDIVGDSGVNAHNPDGEWYYGLDIAVHPEYRGLGIGRKLYDLRKQVVRDFNKHGIIAGGVIPGYSDHRNEMSAEAYVEAVEAGELFDSTLSFQLANGFEVLGTIANFVHDEATDGWAAFIVWYNPDYDPSGT
jgi:ribosomal protein S18 acetylase RimI-like enzyme